MTKLCLDVSVMERLQLHYNTTLCFTVSQCSVLPAFLQISSGTYAEPGRDPMSLWESTQKKEEEEEEEEGMSKAVSTCHSTALCGEVGDDTTTVSSALSARRADGPAVMSRYPALPWGECATQTKLAYLGHAP